MLLGEHIHSLDAKGRIILPARFREALAAAYLTRETDGCLGMWAPDDFVTRAREMKEKTRGDANDRDVARVFFAGAGEANPDRQGRVAIPHHLRTFARLDGEVAVIGAFDHLEIWDAETWRGRSRSGEERLAGSDG